MRCHFLPTFNFDLVHLCSNIKLTAYHLLLYVVYLCQKSSNFVYALICYKQKCKVVSLNLAHPVHVPSVLWYCWLGLLTCRNRILYNLYCVGGDVKHCSVLTHSLCSGSTKRKSENSVINFNPSNVVAKKLLACMLIHPCGLFWETTFQPLWALASPSDFTHTITPIVFPVILVGPVIFSENSNL